MPGVVAVGMFVATGRAEGVGAAGAEHGRLPAW